MMNEELPPPKNVRKMSPADGRFECYWWSAKRSGTAWPECEAEARKACAKGEPEIKWAREKAKTIQQELIKDEELPKFASLRMTKAEHDTKDAERCRISDTCSSWQIGEEIRLRRIWAEECEVWADEVIQSRGKRMEQEGWILSDFRIDELESVECAGDEARARLEHAALWLPVYYEYARQSRKLLMWARMLHTMDERDIMKPGEAAPLILDLKRQLGGGWVSVLRWLSNHLGEDQSFSMIPMERRRKVAMGAVTATLTHIEINRDSWAIEDGGRPACHVESKWAGRQLVSVANHQEATTTKEKQVYDDRLKERSSYSYRDALNATHEESFIKPRDGKWIVGKSEIERRGNDDLKARNVDENGNEVIVLKLNWNETNDDDIGEAMARLCKRIRPTKWPESIDEGGNQKQQRDKALSVLLYWRMTASIDAPIGSGLDEVRQKKELDTMRAGLGRAVRDRSEATKWFHDITGDSDAPWWSDLVSNPK